MMSDTLVEKVRNLKELGELKGQDFTNASDGLQMLVGKCDAAVSLLHENLNESIVSTHRHHRQIELAEIKN